MIALHVLCRLIFCWDCSTGRAVLLGSPPFHCLLIFTHHPHPLTAHWIHPHHLYSPFPLLPHASSPSILVEIRTDSFPTKGGGRKSVSLKKDLWKCLVHLKTDSILEDTCLFFIERLFHSETSIFVVGRITAFHYCVKYIHWEWAI